MRKLFVFIVAFSFTHFSAAASNQHNLCSKPYSYDVFQTLLNLSVNVEDPTLVIDQHIPYGIRPIGNKITQITCNQNLNSLQIFAKSAFNETIRFDFTLYGRPLVQLGKVTYLDLDGHPIRSEDWECSVEAVSKLCLGLIP